MANTASKSQVLNINVGVLGHVDSGKTSLVAALSTSLSTAALDKNPQSKERGITLDLGFSSFKVPMPEHLQQLPYDELQFTLVDCPGHASLIRTIIGGVQIIDMMVLVIDVTKGLQTQTAECLVVGEIATSRMVVALNKVDQLPEADRSKAIRKAQKRLAATFDMTKFAGVPMVPVAAKPGGGEGFSGGPAAVGLDSLKAHLAALVPTAPRQPRGPFLFAIDHCFPVKGQGTVLTGTVLQGSVSINDIIELPALRLTKVVKSMQMFRRPLQRAVQGDRLGICVTQLDAALLERGLAAAPGSVPTFSSAVAQVEKIRFFAGPVVSKAKFHVSVGHSTVMAEAMVFGLPDGQGIPQDAAFQTMIENLDHMASGAEPLGFDFKRDYLHQTELYGLEGRPSSGATAGTARRPALPEGGGDAAPGNHFGPQWMYLQFDQPVTAPRDALIIGARFDGDIHGETCRLAFYGRIVALLDAENKQELSKLQVYKVKEKRGTIERVQPDGCTSICRGLFKKESDLSAFVGLEVVTERGESGVIEGSFGKSGKFKVSFPSGLSLDGHASSGGTPRERALAGGTLGGRSAEDNQIFLTCKRYVFDLDRKKLRQ